MRILITGANGQLGRALRELLEQERPAYRVLASGRKELDITRKEQVREVMEAFHPDVVIHLAAWTDVDGCEQHPRKAREVHVMGTAHLLQEAERWGARFWMAGTDYVFDGEKGKPYVETDSPRPINVYGATKWEGEKHALRYDRAWVVRTSWVFGEGNNFVTKVLRWAARGYLRVVADQVGSPTFTEDLARAILRFLEEDLPYGLYHLSNGGETTRYAWAREILQAAGLDVPLLPACSSEFPTPARRPRATPLENRRWSALGLPPLPPWQDATRRFVRKLLR